MMEYLYSGSINNFSPKTAADLLGLADAYMLEGLKYLCENTLMHNVENDNVCALLIEANKYSSAELKKFCIQFLIKNFQEIQATKSFEELEYYPSLLMEVTKQVFSNANDKGDHMHWVSWTTVIINSLTNLIRTPSASSVFITIKQIYTI